MELAAGWQYGDEVDDSRYTQKETGQGNVERINADSYRESNLTTAWLTMP